MSGIIGKLSFDHDESLAQAVLEQMLEAMRHRGPRGRAIFSAPRIALGACTHLDLEPDALVGANQLDNVHVVADSALVNAPQLRAFLERTGSTFRSGTEAELIAHAYDRWGDACVERLQGPFACAIWDADQQRLLIARDHLGIRPLYFALLHGHGVVFASEIRALLHDPGVDREWCPAAIDSFLALGYVPAPLTTYRRISKLPPAQRLIVEGHAFRLERYWDLPLPSESVSSKAVAGLLEDRLRAAMVSTFTTFAPEGTLFSGGVASAALLAASPEHAGSIVTVTLDQDTATIARTQQVASHLAHVPDIEIATPDVSMVARQLAARFDEPLADPSAVVQYATCVAARLHGESMIAGHGAAPLWAGYSRHRIERLEASVRVWLPDVVAHMGNIARPLQDAIKGARSICHLALPPAEACATKHAYGFWDDEHRRSIYTRTFAWQVRHENAFAQHLDLYAARQSEDALDRALYVEARTFLPDSTLAVAEGAALAAGVRLHFPFLTRDLVEFAARVPSKAKQLGVTGMYPVCELVASHLPASLRHSIARRPARYPWLHHALLDLVPRVLLAERFDCRGIVSRPALRRVWDEHCSGRRTHSHRLWALLMLEFWFREYIDGDASEQPLEYAIVRAA